MVNHQNIAPHEVTVWVCDSNRIDDEKLIKKYYELLNKDQLERYHRFRFDQLRHRFLVSHALLRTTIAKYIDIAPAQIEFEYNQYGRPELASYQNDISLRFNLSNSGDLAAVAVVLQHDIGVDVEHIERQVKFLDVAKRFFSPTEVKQLKRCSKSEQRETFFRIWTLKESYIKARGMGLHLPLQKFSFHLENIESIGISFVSGFDDDPKNWQFESYKPAPAYLLALGIHKKDRQDLTIDIQNCVPLVDY